MAKTSNTHNNNEATTATNNNKQVCWSLSGLRVVPQYGNNFIIRIMLKIIL